MALSAAVRNTINRAYNFHVSTDKLDEPDQILELKLLLTQTRAAQIAQMRAWVAAYKASNTTQINTTIDATATALKAGLTTENTALDTADTALQAEPT